MELDLPSPSMTTFFSSGYLDSKIPYTNDPFALNARKDITAKP